MIIRPVQKMFWIRLATLFQILVLLTVPCFLAGCESADETLWGEIDPTHDPEPEPEPEPHYFGDKNPNVLLDLGDSITEHGYPALLDAMTVETVIDAGRGGQTAAEGANVVLSALVLYKPGYLLVLYGANDVIRGHSQNETINALRSIIRTAWSQLTIPIVGTLTPMSGPYIGYLARIEALNEQILQMAAEEGAFVADLYAAFQPDPASLLLEGLHPTAEGSQVIASTFFDAFLMAKRPAAPEPLPPPEPDTNIVAVVDANSVDVTR